MRPPISAYINKVGHTVFASTSARAFFIGKGYDAQIIDACLTARKGPS